MCLRAISPDLGEVSPDLGDISPDLGEVSLDLGEVSLGSKNVFSSTKNTAPNLGEIETCFALATQNPWERFQGKGDLCLEGRKVYIWD